MPDPTTPSETAPAPGDSSASPCYCSPVLAALSPAERPDPSPACETCPASMWFSNPNELRCFCTRMHLVVWERKSPPVLRCDGRELALLAMEAEAMAAAADKEER